MDTLIEDYKMELCDPDCMPGVPVWSAKVHISNDVSGVMPYLNAVLDRALFDIDNH